MIDAKHLAIAVEALDIAHRTVSQSMSQAGIKAGAEGRAKLAEIEEAHAAVSAALTPAGAQEAAA